MVYGVLIPRQEPSRPPMAAPARLAPPDLTPVERKPTRAVQFWQIRNSGARPRAYRFWRLSGFQGHSE